jgi:hypothetical protein
VSPAAVLDRCIAAFNAGAVIHQVASNPVEGRDAMGAMLAAEFAAARRCNASSKIASPSANGRSWNDAIPRGCAAAASSASSAG